MTLFKENWWFDWILITNNGFLNSFFPLLNWNEDGDGVNAIYSLVNLPKKGMYEWYHMSWHNTHYLMFSKQSSGGAHRDDGQRFLGDLDPPHLSSMSHAVFDTASCRQMFHNGAGTFADFEEEDFMHPKANPGVLRIQPFLRRVQQDTSPSGPSSHNHWHSCPCPRLSLLLWVFSCQCSESMPSQG